MSESTQDPSKPVVVSLREPRLKGSYDLELPAIMKVTREEHLQLNVDIPTSVTMALGAKANIQKLRPQCEKELPGFDLSLFDRIETLALAMGYAHSRHLAASLPTLPVQELSERVLRAREMLIADWTPFALRGWMDVQRIKDLKGTNGYKNQAFDVITLVAMGREAWPRIAGKTAVTAADLDEAETLADQLLTAVGERAQLPAVTAPTADIRNAAYTLFARAYDELRRAAVYLRWHEGDADSFVPPLTAGRKRRGSEVEAEVPDAPETAQPVSAAQPAARPEPTKNGSNVAVGMPGSDPFASA